MSAARKYFAAVGHKEIGSKLMARLEQYAKNDGARRAQYAHAYAHYFGVEAGAGITTGVTRKGEQGELAAVRVNRARSLARALHALVTGPKVSWRPQARNGDSGSAKATSLASGLLEDEWKTKGMVDVWLCWLEQAIAFADAYVFPEWDRSKGPPLAARNGQLILQGDVTLHNVLPWDVFFDGSRGSYKALDCRYVRLEKNRFSLAKMTRRLVDGRTGDECENAILGATGPTELGTSDRATQGGRDSVTGDTDDDTVPVWYFFHDATPALPMGRRTILLSEDVVLEDGPLRPTYDEVPLYRLAAGEMFDTPRGWTPFWDSLGIQEILDGIETTLSTIITTLGNPTVGYEKGSELSPEKIGAGFRTWEHPPGTQPPAAIQLAVFPPNALEYRKELKGDQQQGFGLNDVALGQPQGAQMNAQAFAVLASMAVQQASPLQSAAVTALGRLGTGYLKTLRQHVSRERILKVTGKASQHLYSERRWKGSDLRPIDAATVDVGNPLEQTAAGRTMLLQTYLAVPGVITSPEQIQQVAETGRMEPATRGLRDELQLIQAEYEQLQEGVNPPVHTYQNHPLHYRENAAVLSNSDALGDRGIVDAVHAHLDQHYLEYFGNQPDQDPMRQQRQRFLLGQGPEPMAPPPPPPGQDAPPPPVSPLVPEAEQFVLRLLQGGVPGATVADQLTAAQDILDKHMEGLPDIPTALPPGTPRNGPPSGPAASPPAPGTPGDAPPPPGPGQPTGPSPGLEAVPQPPMPKNPVNGGSFVPGAPPVA